MPLTSQWLDAIKVYFSILTVCCSSRTNVLYLPSVWSFLGPVASPSLFEVSSTVTTPWGEIDFQSPTWAFYYLEVTHFLGLYVIKQKGQKILLTRKGTRLKWGLPGAWGRREVDTDEHWLPRPQLNWASVVTKQNGWPIQYSPLPSPFHFREEESPPGMRQMPPSLQLIICAEWNVAP